MGILGWFQLAFVVLKLTGLINWSWWAVLMPTLFILFFIFVVGVLYVLANLTK